MTMDFKKYDDVFDEKNYPKFRKAEKKDGKLFGAYNILPEDYKPCICLSGKNFKFCCKDKFKETFKLVENGEKKVKREDLYPKDKKKSISRKTECKSINKKNISYCFAKKIFGNCSEKKVASHTMSKGNVLKNLSDGDTVVCFDDHKMIDEVCIENINKAIDERTIKMASTTVSFCKTHDKELFEDIEADGKRNYNSSYIENLEYALKAITFDLYHCIMSIKYMSELFAEHVECAGNSYFEGYNERVKELFSEYPLAVCLLNDIKMFKENKKESQKFKTISIKLPFKKIYYSLSECITLDNTICFLNVVNAINPYIIISYYGDKVFDKLDEWKMKSDNDEDIISEINEFALFSTRNIYFNKKQFNKLSKEAKFYLYYKHRIEGNKVEEKLVNENPKNYDSYYKMKFTENELKKEIISILYEK